MKNSPTNVVVDSEMKIEDILAQNPINQAPQDILVCLNVVSVKYYGFNGILHSGQIVLNKNVIRDVRGFFALALKMKFPIEKVIPVSNKKYKWNDQISCNDNNSSGYNYRFVMGTNRMSKHSAGLAFDINPVQNIFIKYDENLKEVFRFPKDGVYDEKSMGTLTNRHPLVILMKDLGWEWGGDWTPESGRVDYQHFERNIKIS